MSGAAIHGCSLVLAHAPDLVRHGSKPTREGADLAGSLRTYEDALGYPPHQVFIGNLSPDELYAFTANYGSNDVAVVRLPDRKVVAKIPAGASPSGLEVAPDGRTIYVTDWYDYDVVVIDIAYPGETLAALPETPPSAIATGAVPPPTPEGSPAAPAMIPTSAPEKLAQP